MEEINLPEIIREAERILPLLKETMLFLFSSVKEIQIVDDEKIFTAAIKLSGSRRIYIGKNFLKNHIDSTRDLVTVITHELYHQITSSCEKIPDSSLDNFVEDMWINAELTKQFSLYHFFEKFYGENSFLILLRPPTISSYRINKIFSQLFKNPLKIRLLKEIWYKLYLEEMSISNLKKLITSLLRLPIHYQRLPVFLDPEILDQPLINTIKMKIRSGRGSGAGGKLSQYELKSLEKNDNYIDQLIETIINFFTPEGKEKHMMKEEVPYTGVVPKLKRREIIFLSRRVIPIFYENQEAMKSTAFKSAAIYIDVSGSIVDFLPVIFDLLAGLKDYISPPYYQFSTEVTELMGKEVEKKITRTTWGTNINNVIEHAWRKRIKNVIIITDGYWVLTEENKKRMRKMKTLIILVGQKTLLPSVESVLKGVKGDVKVVRWEAEGKR